MILSCLVFSPTFHNMHLLLLRGATRIALSGKDIIRLSFNKKSYVSRMYELHLRV